MKKVACVLAVLGMVGVAGAAEHWRGAGWGGDGTTWGDALNWDDRIPTDTTWDANKATEQGTPSNHDIHVRAEATCGTGTIYDQAGHTTNVTVESGVTMTSSGGLSHNGAGLITVKSNATYDMRYGQLGPNSGSLTILIEEGALLYCSSLRHNNGAMMDVYGELRAYSVSRISAEGTYRLSVYDGGLLRVDSGVPTSGGWSEGGKVTQYVGSTVMLQGDHTGHYTDLVQMGEAGEWEVSYEGGYTYIGLVFNPCNRDVFADTDADGDVDQQDFALFQLCVTGVDAGVPADPVYCQCFDRRNNDYQPGQDGDIDSFDFGAFADCASGPDIPADVSCDD